MILIFIIIGLLDLLLVFLPRLLDVTTACVRVGQLLLVLLTCRGDTLAVVFGDGVTIDIQRWSSGARLTKRLRLRWRRAMLVVRVILKSDVS